MQGLLLGLGLLSSPPCFLANPLIGLMRARISPPDLVSFGRFGAAMGLDGERLVVSSPGPGPSNNGEAVYVYRHSGSKWVREAKLTSGGPANEGFGSDVAISGDTIAVGESSANDLGVSSGAVLVFTRTGHQWTQQARLLAGDGAAGDRFGWSVAIQQNRLVVGAPDDDDAGTDSGSAYVFQRTGMTWTQTAKLLASNGQASAFFGRAVDVDGALIAVGAPQHANVGKGYLFRNVAGVWAQEAFLDSTTNRFGFGCSLAISNDRVVVGQRSLSTGLGDAHVFHRVNGNWMLESVLFPQDWAIGDYFGHDVDIVGDHVLIGSPGTPYFGAAYVFSNSGGAWSQLAKLVPLTTTWPGGLGSSVAMNGSKFCAGDPFDSQVLSSAGAAYVYELVDAYSAYCTAKTNSLGCAPVIAAQGAGSANAAEGMEISCSQVINNTPGLLLYTTAGRANLPFQGGILCVTPPLRRTPGVNSGGNPAPAHDCSGAFSIDMNAFARGLAGGNPAPELGLIGTVVQCQWWGRDQGFAPPFNSMLSSAIEYTVVQ